MKDQLPAHNARCREWAEKQPAKYRDALLAFAYPCDTETLSYTATVKWFSCNTAKRTYPGKFVSRATLFRHLTVFRDHGLIKVETRRNGDKRDASVYTMNLTAVIGDGEPPKVANEPRLPSHSLTRGIRKAGRDNANCNAFGIDMCDNCQSLFGFSEGDEVPEEAYAFHDPMAFEKHTPARYR